MTLGSTTLITTRSGSTYRIRGSQWRKNEDRWQTKYWAHCVDLNEGVWKSWKDVDLAKEYPIQVGMSLYVGSMDVWWLSTTIVSVEEIDEEA